MSIRNHISLIGNIGAILREPEGNKPYKFVLVVNDTWKDEDGELQSHANPIICTLFGKMGRTLAEYSDVGTELHIQGRLKVSQDDKGRYFTEVIIQEYHYGRRPKSQETKAKRTRDEARGEDDMYYEVGSNRKKASKQVVPDLADDDEEYYDLVPPKKTTRKKVAK